jgi:hypothetical protein
MAADLAPVPGFLYGYIERLEAQLPEDNEVVIELTFRKEARDIPTTRDDTLFLVDRRMRFPFDIKFDSPGVMRSKLLLLKMYRITSDDERRLFADLRIDLKDLFRPDEMVIQTTEARAKMSPKPSLTYAFAVYYKTDPRPTTLGTFGKSTIKPPDPPIPAESHVLLLVEGEAATEAEAEDFDEAIIQQSLMLSVPSSAYPSIDELIVRHWYDLGKSKPGHPGVLLANELQKLSGTTLLGAAQYAERRLRDLRSTIHGEEAAIGYFSACLCFAQRLRNAPAAADMATKLFQAAIGKVTELTTPDLQRAFMKSVGKAAGSPEFRAQLAHFRKVLGRSSAFLGECLIEDLDCALANAAVSQAALNTLTVVLAANTAASAFETTLKIRLRRFRQVLLCVLGHDTILQNPKAVLDLAPLIPPTFVYFLLCNIKPDDHLPEALDYQKIDRFALEMSVNFQANLSVDLMFRPDLPALPPDARDLAAF